jgi:hypothetical protein
MRSRWKNSVGAMTHPRELRKPTPAELGLNVTIAIVALTYDGQAVAVSDRMISSNDVFQADDSVALKTIQVADRWFAAFAGDPGAFRVFSRRLIPKLKETSVDEFSIRKLAAESYEELLREDFAAKHLVQLGYKTVEEFRNQGEANLAKPSSTR